jgi:hypothetical protein
MIPVLHCDFNAPVRHGLHRCLRGVWDLEIGDRVKFGCENDGLMAYGVVRALRGGLAGVELREWDSEIQNESRQKKT